MTHITLHTGATVPVLGLGTWQVGREEDEAETVLSAALEAGYRYIDTAFIYGNERQIGKVLREWLDAEKVSREELFISTKLPMTGMRAADVPYFMQLSLEALQLDYVDLYLVHVPFGLLRDGCDSTDDIIDGLVDREVLDMDTDHLAIWKAMEAEVEAGHARAIGLSNFNQQQVERILEHATIPPANLQIELHLYLQQPDLVDFCSQQGISVTAYSPLGSPGSTWLTTGSGSELPDLLSLPEVQEMAERHGKSPAQVLLRHIIQKGLLVVPKSANPERLKQNLEVFDFDLDEEEMATLNAMDRGEEGRIFAMTLMKGVENHPEYPWPERAALKL